MTPTYSKDIAARIIVEAAKFVGLTEVRSNAEWDNLDTPTKDAVAAEFKGELLRVGWQEGWPYCAAFCEVVWRRAYAGRAELPDVKAMLTPGCLLTWEKAVEAGFTSKSPLIGSIGIMRKGATSNGHAFIVVGVNGDRLSTIEANTSPESGSAEKDREGDGVYRKHRMLEFRPTTGLHLLGFVNPCIYV